MRRAVQFLFGSALLSMMACSPITTSSSVTKTSEGQTTEAPPGIIAAQHNAALVRFVNADPEAKELDVVTGDEATFTSVAYKSITPYKEIPRGVTQFKLRAAGGAADLAVGRRELFPGRHYTLVSLPKRKGVARLVAISDDLGLSDPGDARVRLINASTDVDDLDMFLAGTKTRILHGVDAGALTSFTDMQAGAVDIRPAGKSAPPQLSQLKVEPNRVYTFIVVGTTNALDSVEIVDSTEPIMNAVVN